jgi:hypothetical protein
MGGNLHHDEGVVWNPMGFASIGTRNGHSGLKHPKTFPRCARRNKSADGPGKKPRKDEIKDWGRRAKSRE